MEQHSSVLLPFGSEGTFGCRVELAGDWQGKWQASLHSRSADAQIELLAVELRTLTGEAVPPEFTLRWKLPMFDIHCRWHSACANWNTIPPDWSGPLMSQLSGETPILALTGEDSFNRLTVACEEAMRYLEFKAGICEETNELCCELRFFSRPEAPLDHYCTEVRFDCRKIFFSEAVQSASRWLGEFPQYRPLPVPETAHFPWYSTWYSFHHKVFAYELERECALAAQYGMKGLILDGGWYADDDKRGCDFWGDGEVSKMRFPDMSGHVKKIHALGMKYLVWFGVPLIGYHSKAFARFQGKYLRDCKDLDAAVLDPRFPEVREYLIHLYERALREWDIDGFKWDFIDLFGWEKEDPAIRENYAGRDCRSLPLAIDRLLSGAVERLRRIKPELLVEFRQNYIGPAIRKYGNIFRVADCPGEVVSNRAGIVNLRLTSGESAVHSDMLEWHPEAPAEDAARQLLAVLFASPQISVRLETLPESHRKMLKYHLDFMIRHRHALQQGKLLTSGLCEGYGMIRSSDEKECIIAVYQENRVVSLPENGECFLFNGTSADTAAVETARRCHGRIFSVLGEPGAEITFGPGLARIPIPVSGSLHINI